MTAKPGVPGVSVLLCPSWAGSGPVPGRQVPLKWGRVNSCSEHFAFKGRKQRLGHMLFIAGFIALLEPFRKPPEGLQIGSILLQLKKPSRCKLGSLAFYLLLGLMANLSPPPPCLPSVTLHTHTFPLSVMVPVIMNSNPGKTL